MYLKMQALTKTISLIVPQAIQEVLSIPRVSSGFTIGSVCNLMIVIWQVFSFLGDHWLTLEGWTNDSISQVLPSCQ